MKTILYYIIEQIRQDKDNFEKHFLNPLFNDDILNNFSQPNENDSKFELIYQNFILLIQLRNEFR